MKKFKYGPLVYNTVDEEDDSGNYWWPGLPPVNYDEMGIPIDSQGLQCLPLQCPLHPAYKILDPIYSKVLNDHLPSISEWEKWFEDNFITADKHQIKKLILKWYFKQHSKSSNFYALANRARNLEDMVEVIWQQEENNL